MTPEFSRPFRLDNIGPTARDVEIEAGETERTALAKRFGLVAIHRLKARARLVAVAEGVTATGILEADAVQACVATGEPLTASVSEEFSIRFVAPGGPAPADEVELDADALDIVEHDGAAIDLGEAVAQDFALALDPFARHPDADKILKQAGVLREGETGPFAALKALKDRMGST